MTQDRPSSAQNGLAIPAASPAPPVIDVLTLLGETREAILLHNGEPYRLRVTANNKLILTK